MGPAIRIRRSSRLIPAEALTAAASVEPDAEPRAAWLVVQNNRIAKRIIEGALTACLGQARKRCTAIGRYRSAGDVDGGGVAASRVVVGHANLVGVIGIRRGECLRLGNIGRVLVAGDEVYVSSAESEGCQHGLQNLANRTEGGSRGSCRSRTSLCLTEGDQGRSGPHVLLFVDALLVDRRTVKSNRNESIGRAGNDLVLSQCFCDIRSGRGQYAYADQCEEDAR